MFEDEDLYGDMFKRLYVDDLFHDRSRGRELLARAVLAFASGMDKEEFIQQEMRRMTCDWCRIGVPLNENGDHEILGLVLPCEANDADAT